jgi:hypothetical protein
MKQQKKMGIEDLFVFIFPCLTRFPEWTKYYNYDDVRIATLAIANSGYMSLHNLYFIQRHVLDFYKLVEMKLSIQMGEHMIISAPHLECICGKGCCYPEMQFSDYQIKCEQSQILEYIFINCTGEIYFDETGQNFPVNNEVCDIVDSALPENSEYCSNVNIHGLDTAVLLWLKKFFKYKSSHSAWYRVGADLIFEEVARHDPQVLVLEQEWCVS